jgi:hypothetical protein
VDEFVSSRGVVVLVRVREVVFEGGGMVGVIVVGVVEVRDPGAIIPDKIVIIRMVPTMIERDRTESIDLERVVVFGLGGSHPRVGFTIFF